MKKKLLIFVSLILVAQLGFSGGLVVNTNQSTAWTRMLVRDASTNIDAAFYNPAGLIKLNDGIHFSISNQSLFQTQNITNNYSFMNNHEYEGKISAPVFPSIYGVWKKGNVAVSVGFNPVGGGGGAKFDKGLPSMESSFASLVPNLAPLGVTGYNMNMSFEGTSIYWGIQAGVSYEVNDNLSVYLGGRFIIAKNTYNGYIKDVTVATPNGDLAPGTYLQGVSDQAATGAAYAQAGGDGLVPVVDGGGGDYTFAQLEGAGFITAAQRAQIEGGLLQLGIPQAQIDAMTAAQAQGTFYGAADQYSAVAQQLFGQAIYLSGVTGDQEADVSQSGTAFTPIIGANLSVMNDKLNIGFKYEFYTPMNIEDKVVDNKGFVNGGTVGADGVFTPTYMFKDGNITNADIPGFLSLGLRYQIVKPLTIQLGYHTYFDKNAGWATAEDGTKLIDKNFNEYGLGLEYNITEKFLVSAGYLIAISGANEKYQSDLDYSLSTNTFGGGFAYKINDKFTAQIGAFSTSYKEQTVDKVYDVLNADNQVVDGTFQETYNKSTWAFSVGIDISLGSK